MSPSNADGAAGGAFRERAVVGGRTGPRPLDHLSVPPRRLVRLVPVRVVSRVRPPVHRACVAACPNARRSRSLSARNRVTTAATRSTTTTPTITSRPRFPKKHFPIAYDDRFVFASARNARISPIRRFTANKKHVESHGEIFGAIFVAPCISV